MPHICKNHYPMDATPAQPSTSNDDPQIEEEEPEETVPPVKTRKPYIMSPAAREARRLNAQKPRKKVPVDPNQVPPEPIEPAEPPPPRRKRGRPRKHPIEERGTNPDPTPAEDLAELIKEVSRVAVDEHISEMAGAISAEREVLQTSDSKDSSSSSSPRWLVLAAIIIRSQQLPQGQPVALYSKRRPVRDDETGRGWERDTRVVWAQKQDENLPSRQCEGQGNGLDRNRNRSTSSGGEAHATGASGG